MYRNLSQSKWRHRLWNKHQQMTNVHASTRVRMQQLCTWIYKERNEFITHSYFSNEFKHDLVLSFFLLAPQMPDWPKICPYLTTSGLPILSYLNWLHQLTLVHDNSLLQHNCLHRMWKSLPQMSSYTVTSLKLQQSNNLKNPGTGMERSTIQAWVYQGYREDKLLWSVKAAEHTRCHRWNNVRYMCNNKLEIPCIE